MSVPGQIYIAGAGAQSPLGRTLLSSAAAIRASVCAYAEHPFIINKEWEPIVVARAEWLDDGFSAAERISSLAWGAAQEALAPLVQIKSAELCAFIALPDDSTVAQTIQSEFQRIPNLKQLDVITSGHAGGVRAFEKACEKIRGGFNGFCLVGGADSFIDATRLNSADAAGRLHSVNNSWGYTPGEGAAFFLLASVETLRHYELSPIAEVASTATAEEPKVQGSKTVNTGEGLTRAFLKALVGTAPVAHSYCDLNGEPFRADEFAFATTRTSEKFVNAGQFTAPTDCWGDVGAASAVLAASLPIASWQRGYAHGDNVLIWSSSAEQPLRGAMLLRQVIPGRN